jgi:hypothetical protein
VNSTGSWLGLFAATFLCGMVTGLVIAAMTLGIHDVPVYLIEAGLLSIIVIVVVTLMALTWKIRG